MTATTMGSAVDQAIQQLRTARVMVAEDDEVLREQVVRALRRDGYEVSEVTDGDSALQLLGEELFLPDSFPDVIVCESQLKVRSGFDVLSWVRRLGRGTPVILITPREDLGAHALAERLQANAVLESPVDLESLRDLVLDQLIRALAVGGPLAHRSV